MSKNASSKNGVKKKDLTKVKTKFVIDLWATDLHSEKIQLFKHARRASKDRQWSKDSDIIGIINRDGKEWGPIAYRKDEWKTSDYLKSKLILKTFTQSNYWRGSIQLLVGRSVMLSQVSNEPSPVFLVNYNDSQFVTYLQKVPHKNFFSTQGEVWGFDLLISDETGEIQTFEIDDNRFTLGTDFYVKNINDQIVAKIDGKILNVGGKYEIEIYDEDLAKNKRFYTSIVLFTSIIEFIDDIKNRLKIIIRLLQRPGEKLDLDWSEKELYFNPRRAHD